MPLAMGLQATGYLTLDKDQNPVFSIIDINGGMPVFSPYVVTNEELYTAPEFRGMTHDELLAFLWEHSDGF